jgi:uncharacterized protein YqeY
MNIDNLIRVAMLQKQPTILSVLRSLKTEFSKVLTAKGRGGKALTQDEEYAIIRKQIAQRAESFEMFMSGGHQERAQAEEREKVVLEAFLPAALSEAEVDAIITQAVSETGAVTKRDTGKAIARAKELADGRIDLKVLSAQIASRLV